MTKDWIATTAQGYIIVTSAKDKVTALTQAQKELEAGDSIIDFGRL
jgi:hypothetical protein